MLPFTDILCADSIRTLKMLDIVRALLVNAVVAVFLCSPLVELWDGFVVFADALIPCPVAQPLRVPVMIIAAEVIDHFNRFFTFASALLFMLTTIRRRQSPFCYAEGAVSRVL